jgi:hypothetical protein
MWSDGWFAELKPEFKLLFVYLFTNERASVSGLYELPVRIIQFETGLDKEVILAGFAEFQKTEPAKVLYDAETGVVYVRNMLKYQASTSPKVKNRIKADVASVPACSLKDKWLSEYKVLIGYRYGIEKEADGIDTSSSISIYSSSYSSKEGGGAGEETKSTTWVPETPRQAASHPDIKTFEQITGRFPGDRDYEKIIDTIQFLREKHGEKLIEFLKPYWIAWSTRKTKDGKPYSPSNLVWLCEWAMQEEIPKTNGSEPKPNWSPIPSVEETRKLLVEKDELNKNAVTGKAISELAGRMSSHDKRRTPRTI